MLRVIEREIYLKRRWGRERRGCSRPRGGAGWGDAPPYMPEAYKKGGGFWFLTRSKNAYFPL